jgi:hypothetical protein
MKTSYLLTIIGSNPAVILAASKRVVNTFLENEILDFLPPTGLKSQRD